METNLKTIFYESSYRRKKIEPNVALVELERGLRSPDPGKIVESVLLTVELINNFPFPQIVNTIFLKLSDLFKNTSVHSHPFCISIHQFYSDLLIYFSLDRSTNFVRMKILRAFQQSKGHHQKIINVETVTLQITTVLTSNDPIARAIALRVLASLSSVCSEKLSIHHSIRKCFDTHNPHELDASIFAIEKFSQSSAVFAKSIIQPLSSKINSLSSQTI